MNKTVLITGCRGGFGKDTAIALSKKNYKVIASTETLKEAEDLKKEFIQNSITIQVLKLDITKKEDRKKIEELEIDILINNAAIGESGSLSEIDIQKVRNNFEVNVFSTLELTQISLKKMIKKGEGKIIFISSLAGRVTMPFLAPYSMTKFALSSGVEALRAELKLLKNNIKIVLIEPGAYNTGFNQKNIAKKFEWMQKESYFKKDIEKIRNKENKYFDLFEQKNNKSIVKKIVKAVTSKNPKLRYSAPWWQYYGVQIQRIFGK